jgi:hypothetical protein
VSTSVKAGVPAGQYVPVPSNMSAFCNLTEPSLPPVWLPWHHSCLPMLCVTCSNRLVGVRVQPLRMHMHAWLQIPYPTHGVVAQVQTVTHTIHMSHQFLMASDPRSLGNVASTMSELLATIIPPIMAMLHRVEEAGET